MSNPPRALLSAIVPVLLTMPLWIGACGGDDPPPEADPAADPTIETSCRDRAPQFRGAGYPAPIELPGVYSVADPHVILHDGVYYLYPTSSGAGFECWSSHDLEAWRYEGLVWEKGACGTWNDRDLWAPHVLEADGVFYMYYTARQKIGLARATSPLGPFVDVYDHPLIGSGHGGVRFNAIDAFVLEDDDGSLYIYFTGYLPTSVLRVARMPDYEHVSTENETVVTPGLLDWEGVVCEAPWVVKNRGRYYLMYSGNMANFPHYAVGYAVSGSPMGPFAEHPCNPILRSDRPAGFHAPGHHSLVEGLRGETLVFYHTKVEPDVGWTRRIRIGELDFDEEGEISIRPGLDG